MSLTKSLLVSSVLGIAGAVIFFRFFPDYASPAAVDIQLTRSEAIAKAKQYLQEIGYDVQNLDEEGDFRFDSSLALYLEQNRGTVEAHKILKADSLAGHYWFIYFYEDSLNRSQMPNRYHVWVTPTGRLQGFRHYMQDTVAAPSLKEEEARSLAENFLRERGVDLENYMLERAQADQLSKRKDHTFYWAGTDSVFSMTPKIWVRVQGDKIGGFRHDLETPESFNALGSEVQTFVQFVVTGSTIATFFLLIFVIPLFLKKYLEGEVGIKIAVLVFATLFLLTLIEHLLKFSTIGFTFSLGDVNRANVRLIVFVITVFVIHAFLAAMVLGAWSVGESSARRGWSQKLAAIDALFHRKPFTLELAVAILRGYAFGFIFLGIGFGAIALLSSFINVEAFVVGLSGIPESYFPALSAVLLALRVSILNEVVFRLFFVSWLREKTKKLWPGLLVSSLLWTLIAFTMWDFPFGYIDFRVLFPVYFLMGIIFGLILIRFDLMTAIMTNFVLLSCGYAIPMLVSSSSFFETQSTIYFALMGAPLLVAAVGFYRRQEFKFSMELTPTHIRRISERERMAKELEIAHSVQMSLLPRENPKVEGYDIAGICVPALEVGGDYYDFFNLSGHKMGIAIGDVSGKGVPAAIYMTLTKGILQSHAGENSSPKEVLSKINKQMYLNIEKNSFVSMFYAVIDMRSHTIQFSRAGHNPAILAHRATTAHQWLEPKGIALGLESGEWFHAFLEERQLQLQSGDVLTFYTDGFTEASNAKDDEYGEERLLDVVSENKHLPANDIIQAVVGDVKDFVGNHEQRDDMTMVVIKVL